MTVSYSGNFCRLLLRWKGSIWRSVWVELVAFILLFYAVRLFYHYGIPLLDQTGDIFKIFCESRSQYFVINQVRWWRQFECLSWPEDLLSMVCMILPQNTEEARKKRHQIARYVNLVAALAWRDISDKIRLRFPRVRDLIDAGLLTEREFTTLEKMQDLAPGIRWMAPLHWAQQLVSVEVESGRAPSGYLFTFVNELKQYRTSFRKLFCHDWVCVPLVYSQVASLATYSFFLFCLFGRQHIDDDGGFDTVFPIFTVAQFLFYVGWFKVGQDLLRPFGLDDDDIELSYILDRNIVISFAIVNYLQTDPPPTFEEDFYWRHMQEGCMTSSTLKFGRIDLSRTAHSHPPKLHTYVKVRTDENEQNRKQNDEFIIQCRG
uniref:Bestrophin homolog n=1 Tax=Angiostrongylus cantonensis TaxID=6313 RepID=A0A0K0CU88_ANGCA